MDFSQLVNDPNFQVVAAFLTLAASVVTILSIRQWRKKPSKEEGNINEKPLLKVVNKVAEPLNPSEPRKVVYNPNLINYGTTVASNIRIHDKVFTRIVELDELVKPEVEKEIKQRVYNYPGSLLPNDPIRNIPIEWTINENEVSVIRWIEYDYLNKKDQEVIFDARFRLRKDQQLIHYTYDDILKARKDHHTINGL